MTKIAERLIAELQGQVRFLRNLVTQHQDDAHASKQAVKDLEQEINLYRQHIRDQPIPIKYKEFDPKKYASVQQLIYNEAIKLTNETGTWWHWQYLYDVIHKKYPQIPLNSETVRRRCQEAAEPERNFLRRVKPGHFIWKGGIID